MSVQYPPFLLQRVIFKSFSFICFKFGWGGFLYLLLLFENFFLKSIFGSFDYLHRIMVPARNPRTRKDQTLACT